jgi:hypothetical protein
MGSFNTTNKLVFPVNIKTKDIRTIKDLVKYPDGKPVDILDAAETGTLAAIYGDVSVLVDVMFVLCLDQVKEHFDIQAFDEENQWNYELFPERAKEPTMTKASRWFASIINGDSLIQMVEAFNEAVINFTPNENRRSAMRAVLEKEKAMERLEAEYRLRSINLMFQKETENLESRWENFSEREIKKIQNQLDGQFGTSENTPESSE